MHAVADAHDTGLDSEPEGLGVGWIVQLVPSQRSAIGPVPTAVQAVAEMHETPDSWLNLLWLGVGSIVQDVPSQRSASVAATLTSTESPTAVHAVAEVHDTPYRPENGSAPLLGVVWIVQLDPSQRSASVTAAPARLK